METSELLTHPALPREFYLRDTLVIAQRIIGQILIHETVEGVTAGRIVETEAYLVGDPASHTITNTTSRHRVRMGPPGHAYIYMIHGRWIFSVVCQPEGVPEVVHVRALEPLAGIDLMMRRRGIDDIRNLCSGPGKVGQAMGIDGSLYGTDVTTSELRIVEDEEISDLVQTTRVGISHGVDLPYRFYSREHVRWVSKR